MCSKGWFNEHLEHLSHINSLTNTKHASDSLVTLTDNVCNINYHIIMSLFIIYIKDETLKKNQNQNRHFSSSLQQTIRHIISGDLHPVQSFLSTIHYKVCSKCVDMRTSHQPCTGKSHWEVLVTWLI